MRKQTYKKNRKNFKIKKIQTIQKEMRKLKKYIKNNIENQDKDSNIKQNVLDSLAAYNVLVWVMHRCKWTPSKLYCEVINVE